ncbi:MAG: SH3 domain-containing protein [Vallitalea sp.]|jgi:hypothetical protein|nr:SH3 domain-containing protein [Vallitalea sp.]
MNEYRVIKSRKAESNNGIVLKKGQKVICCQDSDENGDWANWVLCKSEDNSGWVPKQIIDREEDKGTILEDYNAVEFNIEVDEIIVMEKELNGWIWGYKKGNQTKKAWTPLNHIEII